MCFACGHEAGQPVAGAAQPRVDAPATPAAGPVPAPALPIPSVDSPFTPGMPRSAAYPVPVAVPPGAPTFAPLPPLPPLPRPPSGAFAPGAPPSGPAALPRLGTSPATLGPGSVPGRDLPGAGAPPPGAHPPSSLPPAAYPPSIGATPSLAFPAGGGSASGVAFPASGGTLPGVGGPAAQGSLPAAPPRTGPFGGATPARATAVRSPPQGPPAATVPATSAASAPALDLSLEQTADTKRPAEGALEVVRRVWESPAAFALVFVVGFAVTFGPGAVWKLRSPDLETLIEAGRSHEVVALLEEREKSGGMEKGDWVLFGHAIADAYGTYRRTEMLTKYAVAVQSKRTDAKALQNTVEALGDPAAQRDAIGVLKLAWPEELAVEARLQERTGDDNVLLRRGAVDALVARNAPSDMVLSVRARVAVADLRSRACPVTREGVDELKRLVQDKAATALKERKVTDALLDLQGDAELAALPCIDKKTVKGLHQEVAALLEGGG